MGFSCERMSRECTGCGGCREAMDARLFCGRCGRALLAGERYLALAGEAVCEDCQVLYQREV